MKQQRSILCILLAGCLWGTLGIFVRRFDAFQIPPMTIVFLRSIITFLATLCLAFFSDRRYVTFRLKDIWIFIGYGLLSIVFFNGCYFTTITMLPLSVAAILLYTSPAFVILLSALIFREPITLRKLGSLAIMFFGLMLVTGVIGDFGQITPLGFLLGLGSALGYGLYSIFSRFAIQRGYHPLTTTCWGFAFAALFSSAAADFSALTSMFRQTPSMIGYSILFAICASVLPYVFYSTGLRHLNNSTAAILACIEPVAATLFGAVLYGEYPSFTGIIGIILVLGSLTLSLDSQKTPPKVSSI